MGNLLYSAITSLDGYVNDAQGEFVWSMPSEQVHQRVNDLERGIGTYLYGRRMYEVMSYWETSEATADGHPVEVDYAQIWRAAGKIVYSRTLQEVASSKTRIERELDLDAVRRMKSSSASDVSVGGPTLAGQLLAAGLVDECHLFVSPVIVGGGTKALPGDVRLKLELVDVERFDNGVVHLHHRVTQ